MAARIGVAGVVKSASRMRPAEQAHDAITGNDAVLWRKERARASAINTP